MDLLIKPNFYFQCIIDGLRENIVGIFSLEGKKFGVFYSKQAARLMLEVIKDNFLKAEKSEISLMEDEIQRCKLPEVHIMEMALKKSHLINDLKKEVTEECYTDPKYWAQIRKYNHIKSIQFLH